MSKNRKHLYAAMAGFAQGAAGYVARKWESERAEAAQARRDERLAAIQAQATEQAQAFQAEQGSLTREHQTSLAQAGYTHASGLADKQMAHQATLTEKQLQQQLEIAKMQDAGALQRTRISAGAARGAGGSSGGRPTLAQDQDGNTHVLHGTPAEVAAQAESLNAKGRRLRLLDASREEEPLADPLAAPTGPKPDQMVWDPQRSQYVVKPQ